MESASAELNNSVPAELSGSRKIVTANSDDPWYSWGVDSGLVMPDYSSGTTSTYDDPYNTATPKPSRPTPKPTMIVDPPRTRPPEDNTLYNLTGADYYQTPDGWQYTLDADGNATIVGYADKNAVTLVLPDSIEGHRVIAIGQFAFTRVDGASPFRNLVSVVIPDTVLEIGYCAFYGCVFSDIRLSDNIVSIGSWAFAQCRYLKRVAIPAGVKTISYRAFYECDSLTEMTIPDSVVNIDTEAFDHCDQLKTVTISENAQVIGTWAFGNCENLQTIIVPAGDIIIANDASNGCDKLTMRVYKNSMAHQYAVAKGIPFQLIENQASPDQGNETIIFYMKPNGKGVSLTRNTGFTAYASTDMGFDDNNLSSVWVSAENVTVKLYELSEYGGQCIVLEGKGLINLSDYDFDNLCSSYAITK